MTVRLAVLGAMAAMAMWGQAKLPPFSKQTLPNGATLLLLKKTDVPLVSVRAVFRGGAEGEPAGLHGLASITSELLQRGTATRTADQIALDLDSIGARLQLGSDRQMSYVATEFVSRTADAALRVFADVLQRPVFPEAEVQKVVARAGDQVRAAKDNPGMAIGRYFNGFYFPPGHPYRYSGTADEASLAKMNREAIEGHYRRMYVGRNLILIAVGDFDPAVLGGQLSKLAGAFPAGTQFVPAKVTAPRFETARLLLVDKPDATQTYFRIGMPGVDRTHPDRAPLLLVNTIFGGRFTSMLNDELRVNTGLTYGATSLLDEDRLPGVIAISSYTRTDATERAIDLALAVLGRLTEKGIDAEQLASAKAYRKGLFPTNRLETSDQLADVLGELEFYGLNKGEIDDLFSRLDAVTLERANEVAKKFYRNAQLQLCLIGNAAKIRDSVKKYAGRMQVVPVSDAGFTAPPF